jgi:hypothetical protein
MIPTSTSSGSPHLGFTALRSGSCVIGQGWESHHDWFEERGPRCVLLAYIDDTNSRVFARFYEYEGTIPAMDSFQRYVRRYGIPLAVYADKHTTDQSPAPPTVDEQLAGVTPMSQLGGRWASWGRADRPTRPRPRGGWSGCSRRCRIAW